MRFESREQVNIVNVLWERVPEAEGFRLCGSQAGRWCVELDAEEDLRGCRCEKVQKRYRAGGL